MENGRDHDRRIANEERARCLEVCRRFALACRVSEERAAQEGKHDDAKEFQTKAIAAEAIASDLEREST